MNDRLPARSDGTAPATRPERVLPDIPRKDRRIHGEETLPGAMHRITVGQFDRIIMQLTDPKRDRNEAVHTARKTMKRLRGLLRLVRDEIGREVYRNENAVLRDTSRRLAAASDAFVLVETLQRLRSTYKHLIGPDTFRATKRYLSERHRLEMEYLLANDQLITDVVVTLKVARLRYATFPVHDEDHRPGQLAVRPLSNRFGSIEPGLQRVYRRGRNAMREALETRHDEAYHNWRKRVKYLRYQLESLEMIWPEAIQAHAHRLDDLGEVLGTEHDLSVLAEVVLADPAACPDPQERTLLLAVIYQSRFELQTAVAPLGESLYAEEPEAFTGRIGAYWRASRRTA